MRLAEIWRHPVKSLGGERLERATLTETGIEGDRVVRAMRGHQRVSALTVPGLLGLAATIGADGEPEIDGVRWDRPEALEAIRELAGPAVRLVRDDSVHRFDDAPILVTTDGALEALGEDRRRFRSNLVVEGVEGLGERDWVGGRLRVGAAQLLVRSHCERCLITSIDPDTLETEPGILRRIRTDFNAVMGVYCEVALGGEIAEGDPVEAL